jgi:DNA polymerase III alpha subunit
MRLKGKIKEIDIRKTYQGGQIAFVIFTTATDQEIELIVYPNIFRQFAQFLEKPGMQVTVTGVMQRHNLGEYLMVQKIK